MNKEALHEIIAKRMKLDPNDPIVAEQLKIEMKKFVNKEAEKHKNQIETILIDLENAPKTLKELYKRISKWLHISDWYMIDIILAVTLSNQASNTKPIWIFLVGHSGDGKSEITMALDLYTNVEVLDKITSNTFVSGMTVKGIRADDLGKTLQNSSHILVFSDLACLKSINVNEKGEIWGQFRELYEGRINKRTGAKGAEKTIYNNCHITMIACSTPDIKSEYTIYNQLGTREFSYDIEWTPVDNKKKMKKALEHHEKEKEMKEDLKNIIQGFLMTRKFDDSIEWSEQLENWVMEKCEELALFRASVQFEKITGELRGTVDQEVPTRLIQQIHLLYKSLKSLEKDYPDEKFKDVLRNIVKSSGEPIRQIVYNFFKSCSEGEKYHVMGLHERLNYGRRTIKKQCEVLTFAGYLERTVEMEAYGASSQFEREVIYYRWRSREEREKKFYGQTRIDEK